MTLMAAMHRLPAPDREAIALHYVADLPINEVATATGVPEGTVKSRLYRGRAALAVLLADSPDSGRWCVMADLDRLFAPSPTGWTGPLREGSSMTVVTQPAGRPDGRAAAPAPRPLDQSPTR